MFVFQTFLRINTLFTVLVHLKQELKEQSPGGTPICKGQGSSSFCSGVQISDFGLTYTPLYLAVKVSFRFAPEGIYKNIFFQFVLFTLLGVRKKTLGHAQVGLL